MHNALLNFFNVIEQRSRCCSRRWLMRKPKFGVKTRVRDLGSGLRSVLVLKWSTCNATTSGPMSYNIACDIRCSRMMRVGNYMTFSSNMELILKLYVTCVMLSILNLLITFNPGCAVKFGYNCMSVKFIWACFLCFFFIFCYQFFGE